MTGALLIAAAVIITAILLAILDKKRRQGKGEENVVSAPQVAAGEGECCGKHDICLKDGKNWRPGIDETLYYDDEELDRFRDRNPDDYSDEEIEEFRSIMLTLGPGEAPGWHESLRLRGILPPESIQNELDLLIRETLAGESV